MIQLSSYRKITSVFYDNVGIYITLPARSMVLRSFIPWNMRTMYVNKPLQDEATFLQA